MIFSITMWWLEEERIKKMNKNKGRLISNTRKFPKLNHFPTTLYMNKPSSLCPLLAFIFLEILKLKLLIESQQNTVQCDIPRKWFRRLKWISSKDSESMLLASIDPSANSAINSKLQTEEYSLFENSIYHTR